MQQAICSIQGRWIPSSAGEIPSSDPKQMATFLSDLASPLFAVRLQDGSTALVKGGIATLGAFSSEKCYPLLAYAPTLLPEMLGDSKFRSKYGLKYACVSGSMANGIASEELVVAMSERGMMGFFGAAGLAPERVEASIHSLQKKLGDKAYGFNLIHSPNDPALEASIVELYLNNGVRLIEASAFMSLTLPLLRFRYSGITKRSDGTIEVPHSVMAKVSRLEMARKFLSPPPADMLQKLVQNGYINDEQAELASHIPVCSELTAEADSGGHTDNRPAISMWPSMLELRDRIEDEHGYRVPVGVAGGISTPVSALAAFAMGASYIVTGSINQACLESGSCDHVREVLSKASQADCTMAPAADMFEMGVNVQVLKWGTMFPVKARKLYNWYRQYDSFSDMPSDIIAQIERDYLRTTIDECWASTREFFAKRDPRQIVKAESDPKHLMALVFRSYLGKASRWANVGDPTRKPDYQIWCGPAIGAFNEWTAGTFLADYKKRHAGLVSLNIMTGAAYMSRLDILRKQGVELPATLAQFIPQENI